MTLYTRRAIIVIKAVDRASSNTDTKLIDNAGGEYVFVGTALVPKSRGKPPTTHYWCNWACTQETWGNLWLEFNDNNGKHQSRMFDAAKWTPQQVLDEMGLMVPRAELRL